MRIEPGFQDGSIDAQNLGVSVGIGREMPRPAINGGYLSKPLNGLHLRQHGHLAILVHIADQQRPFQHAKQTLTVFTQKEQLLPMGQPHGSGQGHQGRLQLAVTGAVPPV